MEFKESETMIHSDCVELQRKATSALKADLSLPGDTTTGSNGDASSIPSLNRTSSSSEDMQGLGHLDPKTSVLLRFEGMKSAELKVTLVHEHLYFVCSNDKVQQLLPGMMGVNV